ncbi:MAG: type transport system permease protein [Candidatus Eremiobacteraeota bacterium]|nr:type transport system permease protein [Candidatus Eremiobacteraeota bacterium]
MNTIGVIFSAEFVRRIKSKAFLAGTLIGAASILLIAILPSLLGGAMSSSSKKIVLVGDPALTATAKTLLQRDFEITASLTKLDAPPTPAFLDGHGKASAVAILSRPPGDGLRVVAYARDPSAFRESFGKDLAPLQVALATGVPVERVAAHLNVTVDVHDVSGRFADASSADAAKGVAYLFIMMLYLSILLNAQSIMTSVAEEKTSRIAELLVSTIEPAQLLAAKILAAAATGFIQLAVWVVAGALSGRVATRMFPQPDGASSSTTMLGAFDVSSGEIVAFLAFFVVGFAQYGVLYAAAASLINRTEDLGSVAGPLVVPVVLGIILAQIALQFPNSPNMVICSLIPLISPFVMFTRVAVSDVPAWQLVLSLAINVGTAVLLAWLSGKIYRVGMLLYGRPPSLKQVIATLRT